MYACFCVAFRGEYTDYTITRLALAGFFGGFTVGRGSKRKSKQIYESTNAPGVIDFAIIIHNIVEGFFVDPSPRVIQHEGILKSLAKREILECLFKRTREVYGLNSPGIV
jgi:hypothetical protein